MGKLEKTAVLSAAAILFIISQYCILFVSDYAAGIIFFALSGAAAHLFFSGNYEKIRNLLLEKIKRDSEKKQVIVPLENNKQPGAGMSALNAVKQNEKAQDVVPPAGAGAADAVTASPFLNFDFYIYKKWFLFLAALFFVAAQPVLILQKLMPAIALLFAAGAAVIYYLTIKEEKIQISFGVKQIGTVFLGAAGIALVILGWIQLLSKTHLTQNIGAFVTAAGLLILYFVLPQNRMALEENRNESEVLFLNNRFFDNIFVKIALIITIIISLKAGNHIIKSPELNMFSMIFFGIAIAAFFFAMPLIKPREDLHQNPWLNILRLIMVLAAFYFAYNGQKLFASNQVNKAVVQFLIAAGLLILFFPVAIRAAGRIEENDKIPLPFEIIFVLSITAGAFFLRIHEIDIRPFGIENDEAGGVVSIVKNFWVGQHPIYAYIQEFFYGVFGVNRIGIRASGIAIGTLTVPAMYFAIRAMFGPRTAVFAAVAFAFLRWNLHYGRSGHGTVMMIIAETLAVYFILKSIQKRDKFNYFMAGLSSGLCWYGVLTGWFVVLAPLAYMFFESFSKKQYFRRNFVGILVFLLGFWIFGSHHIKNYFLSSKVYFSRISEVSVFSKDPNAPVMNPAKGIIDNTKRVLLMFNHHGDSRQRNSGGQPYDPTIDFTSAIFFGMGFLYCVYFSKYYLGFIIVMLFFSQAAGSIFAIEAPSAMRAVGTMIPVVFFMAMGFDILRRSFTNVFNGKKTAWLVYLLLLGVCLTPIIKENYSQYFKRWVGGMDELSTAAGMYSEKLGKDYRIFLYTGLYYPGHPPYRIFRWDYKVDSSGNFTDTIHVLTKVENENYAIFAHYDVWDTMGYWETQFPNIKKDTYSHEGFGKMFDVYTISNEEIARVRGLKAVYSYGNIRKEAENQIPGFDNRPFSSSSFSAEWSGLIYIPYYCAVVFENRGNVAASLEIGGNRVEKGSEVRLAKGLHNIKIKAVKRQETDKLKIQMRAHRLQGGVRGHPEVIQLTNQNLYSMPNYGMHVYYYSGTNWDMSPIEDEEIKPAVFYTQRPVNNAPTARFSGYLDVPETGVYEFGVNGNGLIAVVVGGRQYWDNQGNEMRENYFRLKGFEPVKKFKLEKGRVKLDVYTKNSSMLSLKWKNNPAADFEVLPVNLLTPDNRITGR